MLESWSQIEDCISCRQKSFLNHPEGLLTTETGAVKFKHVPLKQLTHLLSIYCLGLSDVKLAPASGAAVALRPVDLETVINHILNKQLIISNTFLTY